MNIDIWLFVAATCFAIIGFLANLIVIVVAWAVKKQVSSMESTITHLVDTDERLATGLTRLERELAAHKLHVSEWYAKQSDIKAIFAELKDLREVLMAEIKSYAETVNARIDHLHPPGQ